MSKKILIADDDTDILEVIKFILEIEKYEVKTIKSAHNLTDILEKEEYDFVLLDIWMSGIDGRDVCKEVKSNENLSHIPVVLFSASKDMRESALACGANDFLEKPFEKAHLLELVKQYA